MMINNNPYNLPDRSNQKTGRIYTETSSAQYRKNDSLDNSQSFTQSSARKHNNGTSGNMMMKKSSINIDEQTPNFRPPIYPGVKNDFKHYLPSPKNQSSSSNISTFSNMSSQRNSFNYRSDQNETSNNQPISNSMLALEIKEIQEKIQTLHYSIKSNQKKISELQKNNGSSMFLPNNSAILNEQLANNNNLDIYTNMLTRYQNQSKNEFSSIKFTIQNLKTELKAINQFQKLDHLKTSQIQAIPSKNKVLQTTIQQIRDDLKKDIHRSKIQLEQKINMNHQFLTSVISRLQRQIHSNSNQIIPSYKSSAIKCSGSAILLRFVQCFKVRKNTSTNKLGQIKIVLTDNTYYIDAQGYLLDKQQHYLIDTKGNQVRLEQKHVKLLKDQKVLM